MSDPFATYDAAYVLGSLSPEERDAFEEHLRSCDACARSVRELAGLPGLLAQVPPDAPSIEEPPADLLPSALDAVRRSRTRRLVVTVAASVTALAACLALALVLLLPGGGGESAGTPMVALGNYPVQAVANVADAPTGAKVKMDCSYRGAAEGDYVLVAVHQSGAEQKLASWRARPDDTASISVATGWSRSELAALEIRLPNGKTLLRWQP